MNHTIPERKDTDPRFHWHIEDYFKTDADWEAAYVSLEESLPELTAFAGKLEQACFTTLNQGTMTKDLAGLVGEGFTAHAVTSAQFIAAIRQNLEAAL